MTTTAQLLTAYQALRRTQAGSELPPMQSAGLQQQHHRHDQPAALWAAFMAHAPVQGWLQFQSHQLVFVDSLPDPAPEWGALLQAEAVTADGLSLSAHRPPAGGWVLVESRHLEQGDLLCDTVQHLTHDARLGKLSYRRYWQLDPKLGALQTAASFTGFDPNHSKGA